MNIRTAKERLRDQTGNRKDIRSIYALSVGMLFGFISAYLILLSTWNDKHCNWYDIDGNASKRTEVPATKFHWIANNKVSRDMFAKIRVLCWVLTDSKQHKRRAIHVKATWGQRCNELIFFSDVTDPNLPAIVLPTNYQERDNEWHKTKQALKYLYKQHYNNFDWFLKADDQTYVIMENLRFLLAEYDSNKLLFFGCRMRFDHVVYQGYASDSAGYVLSRNGLQQFVISAYSFTAELLNGHELVHHDIKLGICLEKVGVRAVDTRDSFGRERFHPMELADHVSNVNRSDLEEYSLWRDRYYKEHAYDEWDTDCCSDTAISYHYITPRHMYAMDYLIYMLRPYGVSHL